MNPDRYALVEGNYGGFSVPTYRPAGYSFNTSPRTLYGVSLASTTSASIEEDLKTLSDYLMEQKLQRSTPEFTADSPTISNTSTEFYSDKVVCLVMTTNVSLPFGNYQANMGCADIASYTENAKLATEIDVMSANKEVSSLPQAGTSVSRVVTKDSKTAGYKTAETTISNEYAQAGSAVSLFYQTPDKKWHFFTRAQAVLPCTDFNTDDLKKAYLDTPCSDTAGRNLTVKP